MERVTYYKNYRIEAKVQPVDARRDPAHAGKWKASEYEIGRGGDSYTGKQEVHELRYCDSEEEAIRVTWALAKKGIDRGAVSM